MKLERKFMTICVLMTVSLFVSISDSAYITNGDFAAGDISGWSVFRTTYGNNGFAVPPVVQFETCLLQDCKNALKFSVGTTRYPHSGGGGISQIVTLPAGNFELSVCTAVLDTKSASSLANQDGGLFELLFDGVVAASYNYGVIAKDITYSHILTANLEDVSAGDHEIRIRITRQYKSTTGAPYQYVGCISLVPEPTTIAMLGLGGLIILKRKFKTTN